MYIGVLEEGKIKARKRGLKNNYIIYFKIGS